LRAFGTVLHRRRKRRHGRKKGPALTAYAGFLAGVLKARDTAGDVVKVKAEALSCRLKAIKHRVVVLKIGTTVNTAHVERLNGTLAGRTPAMDMGLSERVWSVPEYIRYPVRVGDLTRPIRAEERENVLTSALDRHKRRKSVPSSWWTTTNRISAVSGIAFHPVRSNGAEESAAIGSRPAAPRPVRSDQAR
jgi:hypothetical protein